MSFPKELLRADIRRLAWSDHNLLEGCATLSAEELERDLRISHGGILGTLGHIYCGERVWLHCLRTTADFGTWRLPPGPEPGIPLELLKKKWPELWTGFDDWLENLPESGLGIELTLQLPGGIERRFPRWKILRHVLEHSTMHGGQMIGMFRMLGHQPPASSPMDFYLAGEPNIVAEMRR